MTPAIFAEAPARSRGKHARAKRTASPQSRLGWPDVLRAVQGAKARQSVLGAYRAAGFTPDDFGASTMAARQAVAAILTRTEDAMELRQVKPTPERLAVADLRRRLEGELWP